MRWRMAWAIPWLLAAALTVLQTRGSTAQDGDLLVNGGFEDDTEGWLAVGGELTASDAFVHGGSHAGVFVADGTSSRREVSHCVSVVPAADYEFSGYAARQEEGMLSTHLSVSWYSQGNCWGDEVGGGAGPGSVALENPDTWYELMVSARSPANARAARLRIVLEESEGTLYLDDFAVDGPPVPTETPTLEPSPSPSASASPESPPASDSTATAEPLTPSPSPTPRISPTASSWKRTPVPVGSGLENGGFEEGDPDGLPSYWRKYGGDLARVDDVHYEGQFAAAFSSRTSSTKWVYQTVTVHKGRAYVLSAYALKDDPAVAAAYLRVSWYASPDGSGGAIETADSTERLTGDSPTFRFLTTEAEVAPNEAASAKVRLMLDPVDETPGTIYFDAVTFEETALPKPTPSPTATPLPAEDSRSITTPSPTVTESLSTPTSAPPTAPRPTSSATTPRPSPTAASIEDDGVPAALGAARAPVATATTAAPTPTRAPPAVYRQRRSNPSVGDRAAAREDSDGGGLSLLLLALAAGVPVLASAGAGVYYWRWRRARLR
jgi:hypothetical protein